MRRSKRAATVSLQLTLVLPNTTALADLRHPEKVFLGGGVSSNVASRLVACRGRGEFSRVEVSSAASRLARVEVSSAASRLVAFRADGDLRGERSRRGILATTVARGNRPEGRVPKGADVRLGRESQVRWGRDFFSKSSADIDKCSEDLV